MQICDFVSWIQLSATLNIAFVAIEYVKSYAKVIYEQVFNISNTLEAHFAPCLETLGDEETVNHLIPRTIENHNTSSQIEKVKREREILTNKISSSKESILKETNAKCNTRSTSSLSLFVFLYSLYGLFLAGIEQATMSYTHAIWSILTFGAVIYSVFGWICGERKIKAPALNFASLWHPVVASIILLAIAIIISCEFTYFSSAFVEEIWPVVLFASLVIMYLNFIIFISNIGVKARQIRKTIQDSAKPIKEECNNWKGQLDQLLTLEELHNGLNAE